MQPSFERPRFLLSKDESAAFSAANEQSLELLLTGRGQEHLLAHIQSLPGDAREALVRRITSIDWSDLKNTYVAPDVSVAAPPPVVTRSERELLREDVTAAGEAAYSRGEVAVLMVAGGQGTRLNFERAKGCYPICALSGKTFYQLSSEKVLALSSRTGHEVPLLVQTSHATDAETRAFFAAHGHFGLSPSQVFFFSQGKAPTLDQEGRVLLAEPGVLLENPDGHGGCLDALAKAGLLKMLRTRGVEHIVYKQVDNPLSPVDDPFAVGLRVIRQADVVSKVLSKTDPSEKVGNLVEIGGRQVMVEYSDLTLAQLSHRAPDGGLHIRWGNPAMHVFGVAFLDDAVSSGVSLPYHVARKEVRAWNGQEMETTVGFKREKFIFDILAVATNVALEIGRTEEFAPVKNDSGRDSPDSARQMMTDEYARWLRDVGVQVDLKPGDHIEISPLVAATAEQLKSAVERGVISLAPVINENFYLEVSRG